MGQHLAHRVPVQTEHPGSFPDAHPLHCECRAIKLVDVANISGTQTPGVAVRVFLQGFRGLHKYCCWRGPLAWRVYLIAMLGQEVTELRLTTF